MDILIPSQSQGPTLLATTRTHACTVRLVDNNTIGCCGCYESGAVGEHCRFGVGMEGDVGDAIAKSADEEGDVSDEPAELVDMSFTWVGAASEI